eukprot:2527139-Alexandrium_andersonii.AAC.3
MPAIRRTVDDKAPRLVSVSWQTMSLAASQPAKPPRGAQGRETQQVPAGSLPARGPAHSARVAFSPPARAHSGGPHPQRTQPRCHFGRVSCMLASRHKATALAPSPAMATPREESRRVMERVPWHASSRLLSRHWLSAHSVMLSPCRQEGCGPPPARAGEGRGVGEVPAGRRCPARGLLVGAPASVAHPVVWLALMCTLHILGLVVADAVRSAWDRSSSLLRANRRAGHAR